MYGKFEKSKKLLYSTQIFSGACIHPESITHFYKQGNLDNESGQEGSRFFATGGRITLFSGRRFYNGERDGCLEIHIDGTIVEYLHDNLVSFAEIEFIISDSRIIETELIIGFRIHEMVIGIIGVEEFCTG